MSLMLVDIATVYYRAYFSQPDSLKSPDGRTINAVRGTLEALTYFVAEFEPEHLVTAWDLDWRPEWRVELLDTYKTARVAAEDEEQMPETLDDQVDMIRQILTDWNVPCVGLDGYEADDIVAQYARTSQQKTFVVSGDRDLFQLIDDSKPVHVLFTGTGISRHTYVDGDHIQTKYGISAQQYGEFSVLRGDASDGLPGVKGVGEKTAAKLLSEFGTIAECLKAAKKSDPRITPRIAQNLIEHEEYIDKAKQVVLLTQKIKVPALTSQWKEVGHSPLLEELGIGRFEKVWTEVVQS
jgi:5'-3' exonuclease